MTLPLIYHSLGISPIPFCAFCRRGGIDNLVPFKRVSPGRSADVESLEEIGTYVAPDAAALNPLCADRADGFDSHARAALSTWLDNARAASRPWVFKGFRHYYDGPASRPHA
jgi:hypothetical protein